MNDEEKEFLAHYDLKKYDRPAVTSDCVVLARKTGGRRAILLIRRGNHPFKNCWALPGGFLNPNETAEQCALRELAEETSLEADRLVPLGCFSTPHRDPRGWILSNAFLVLLTGDPCVKSGDDAADARWFDLSGSCSDERLTFQLTSGSVQISAQLKSVSVFGIQKFEPLPAATPSALAFDHAEIIAAAIALLPGMDS